MVIGDHGKRLSPRHNMDHSRVCAARTMVYEVVEWLNGGIFIFNKRLPHEEF